jgi:thiol-disulfide isomerase/thioredoxin
MTLLKRFFPHLLWLLMALAPALQASQPDFSLQGLDGRTHRLSDYRGKWVLVNYWATWCPPCREELPELEVFYSNNQDKAVVLGVNLEDIDAASLREFVDEQFLSFPILHGDRTAVGVLGPVRGLPTSYLVSPQGQVVASQVGPVTAAGIQRFINNYQP